MAIIVVIVVIVVVLVILVVIVCRLAKESLCLGPLSMAGIHFVALLHHLLNKRGRQAAKTLLRASV
jgi:hypothetical protein